MKNFSLALTYDDVLLVPQYSEVSSRSQVSLETNLTKKIRLKFPVTSANMDTVTNKSMAKSMFKFGGVSFYPRFMTPDQQANDILELTKQGVFVVPAVGIKQGELERVKLLLSKCNIKCILIDVAHGHLKSNLDFVHNIHKLYPEIEIIAGNIATYEGAKALFMAGATTVKVGVGPGSICTTRKVTGSGVPQITAISEAYKAAQEANGYVLADGGMTSSGDIVKALAAGASTVMVGNILSGTDEAPGEIIEKDGKKYKKYNGSTSLEEKKKQVKKFAKGKDKFYTLHVEGVEAYIPYKGPVLAILQQIEMGIRSGFSYSGAFNIREFHKKARFVQIISSTQSRNGAHSVILDL